MPVAPPHPETRADRRRDQKRTLPLWTETLLLLGLAIVLAVIIKTLFLQAFYIPSESMEPGLVENDRILVQKVSYWGDGKPKRGDVVVFEDPGGWLGGRTENLNAVQSALAQIGLYPTGGHLVKRVIGVAGDTIECCDRRGRLAINGEAIDESGYINDAVPINCNGPMTGTCDWTVGPVPEGHVFVMGDNRGRSADSTARICKDPEKNQCVPGREFVSLDLVVGKVAVLAWPPSRATFVDEPKVLQTVPDGTVP